MDYKYEEALERARELHEAGNALTKSQMEIVFPELKENEDESIRKEIIEYLTVTREKDLVGHPERQCWIAYLEKQKDKVIEFDNDKEQKNKIACWKSLGECSDIPDGHYVVGWFHKGDFRLGIMCNGLFVDTNGNRAEQPKEVFYIPNADEEFVYAEQKPADQGVKGRRGRIGGIPENIRKKAENFLSKMEPPYDADDICSAYETGAMESIKPEWSEEDQRVCDGIIAILEAWDRSHTAPGGIQSLVPKYCLWLETRLKSLRPQQHWEPSEEQMKALNAINCHGALSYVGQQEHLISLYNDIKKL